MKGRLVMKKREIDCKTLFDLGNRITDLREKKGLSQLRLAYLADISKTYLSDLENGRRNPTIIILNSIAKALGVSLKDLFEDKEIEKKSTFPNYFIK